MHHDSLLIGGQWVPSASGSRISVVSPVSEQVIGSVPMAAPQDVDAAVAAARSAFDEPAGWSSWDPAIRADALRRFAEALDRRAGEIVRAVSSQNGMPSAIGRRSEGRLPATLLRYYAELARSTPLEEERAALAGGVTRVVRSPIGVVAAIVPLNYPQCLSFFKLAPALAAGCSVVMKPSPETVIDAYLVAEAVLEAGLPPGVVNIVPAGREVGMHLVGHPGVDKVSFTGSTSAGREIGALCGSLLRPVTLELGGKSAAIVLDDADLAERAAELFGACLVNNGQTCYISTRILASRRRYAEVVDIFSDLARSLVIGDPLDLQTQIGPVVSERQRTRIEAVIGKAVDDGARITAGGGRPAGIDRGWFVEPTILADVDNSSQLAQEEIFGPVLAVIPYDDVDDAVRIANDSRYGLGGTVWSADEERALAVARRIHTGSVGVNGYMIDPAAPFGGVKASGLGSELGPEALAGYQQTKSIYT
ncbi:aldehyde dehydrogenase [Nocardia vaccinii]|uniref:aldehyde dehydrogenase n=1 Tax=Nocardia vaccinii TaxID=1822 RepID=UPI0008378233|nr:aldehyde dehydrogenase [Nocardia vaccinii]